jgi:hypothetical protein
MNLVSNYFGQSQTHAKMINANWMDEKKIQIDVLVVALL